MTQNQPSLDALVKYSRRCIQLALIVIFTLSTIAILNFTTLAGVNTLSNLMTLLPIFIIFAIVWLQWIKKKNGVSNGSAALTTIFNDELRRQSISKAFRTSFIITIIAQVPFSLLLNSSSLNNATLILGATTMVFGISSFLLFFLYFDR